MSVTDRNFLVFEGPDFSGKSTLHEAVVERVKSLGIDPVVLREPGGTELGERLRHILLAKYNETVHPETDVLLHMAYRIQNVRELVSPALRAGRWVIQDRFLYSTWSLNVQANLPTHPQLPELFWYLMPTVTSGIIPEPVVFLLKTPKEVRDQRKEERRQRDGDIDRYESQDEATQARIDASYVQLEHGPSTFIIDGTLPLEEQVDIVMETMRLHVERIEDEAVRKAELLKVVEGKQDEEPVKEPEVDQELVDLNPVPVDFDLESSLEDYAQKNIVDALFDEVPDDKIEAVKAEYRVLAKAIAREIFERTGKDQTIFAGSRVGQLNQHIHSLIHYGHKLQQWKDKVSESPVDESTSG